jgi:hypothetical protein
MPYIKQSERDELDPAIENLALYLNGRSNQKGNLNYAITKLIHLHIESVGKKYDTLSDVHGVLADVQAEFYRRVVAPYEEFKIHENGDVT